MKSCRPLNVSLNHRNDYKGNISFKQGVLKRLANSCIKAILYYFAGVYDGSVQILIPPDGNCKVGVRLLTSQGLFFFLSKKDCDSLFSLYPQS